MLTIFFSFSGHRSNDVEQAPPRSQHQPQLLEAQVRHQHVLRPEPLCRSCLLRHQRIFRQKSGYVLSWSPTTCARFKESFFAEHLSRWVEHGVWDPETNPDSFCSVQEISWSFDGNSGTLQSVLHSMHQAEWVQETNGENLILIFYGGHLFDHLLWSIFQSSLHILQITIFFTC